MTIYIFQLDNGGVKKKIGTLLDEDLLRDAREFSVRKGIPLNELLEKALQQYLKADDSQLLSLEEALHAEAGSHSNLGKGRGA